MLVRHCNRCGEVISKQTVYYELVLDRYIRENTKKVDPNDYYPKQYDLCEKCLQDFKVFIRG